MMSKEKGFAGQRPEGWIIGRRVLRVTFGTGSFGMISGRRDCTGMFYFIMDEDQLTREYFFCLFLTEKASAKNKLAGQTIEPGAGRNVVF
jgi:hypothetical protein